jgi:hypothetical protein
MSWEEKRNWVFLVVTTVTYVAYVAIIVVRAQDTLLTEVPYAWPMLGSIAAWIVATIVGSIFAAIAAPGEAGKKDERDTSIHRYGEVIGYTVFSASIFGALGLTMAEVAHFWIGNAIYLSGVLAALITTAVKLGAYRRGAPTW